MITTKFLLKKFTNIKNLSSVFIILEASVDVTIPDGVGVGVAVSVDDVVIASSGVPYTF